MNEPVYRFRTSLSGFHKGDVTAYIEMTASQYRSNLLECEKTIIALQEENRSLQQQLNLKKNTFYKLVKEEGAAK